MLELERLGVRVVSGRLKSGGPGGESGGAGVGDDDSADSGGGGGGDNKGVNSNNMSGVSFYVFFVFIRSTHLMLKIYLCIDIMLD